MELNEIIAHAVKKIHNHEPLSYEEARPIMHVYNYKPDLIWEMIHQELLLTGITSDADIQHDLKIIKESYSIQLSDDIDTEVRKAVALYLPALSNNDNKNLVTFMVRYLVLALAQCHSIPPEEFLEKLVANDYLELQWLVKLVLPYIYNKSSLDNFTNLYIEKAPLTAEETAHRDQIRELCREANRHSDLIDSGNADISCNEPMYRYSTLQYGRCIQRNLLQGKPITEHPYSDDELLFNHKLLLLTIRKLSHKFCTNWKTIFPMTPAEIEDSQCYKDTLRKFKESALSDFNIDVFNIAEHPQIRTDVTRLQNQFQGLYIGDIYNTISIDLNYDFRQVNWLLTPMLDIEYDSVADRYTGLERRIIRKITVDTLIESIGTLLTPQLMANVTWDLLGQTEQRKFVELFTAYQWIPPPAVDAATGRANQHFLDGYNDDSNRVKQLNVLMTLMNTIKSEGKPLLSLISDSDANARRSPTLTNCAQDWGVQLKNFSQQLHSLMSPDPEIRPSVFFDNIDSTLFHGVAYLAAIVYEHLRKAMIIFRRSWYGYILLNAEKTALKSDEQLQNLQLPMYNPQETHTFVFFMSYVPLMQHYCYQICKQNDQSRFPQHWDTLGAGSRKTFLGRFHNPNNLEDWFSIKSLLVGVIQDHAIVLRNKYLEQHPGKDRKKIDDDRWAADVMVDLFNMSPGNDVRRQNLGKINKQLVKQINGDIHAKLHPLIIKVIMESLCQKGVLTRYLVTTPDASDPNFSLRRFIEAQSLMNSYHWLSKIPLKATPSFVSQDKVYDDSQQLGSFLEYALDTKWYELIPYNWISQINCCHRVVHNRVWFLTAETGAGKSTELVKLMVYFNIACNYLNNCRLVCSEPRKDPTVSNAERVALTLGYPNTINPETNDRYPNYYVQFSHSDAKHLTTAIERRFLPSITYMTDGSLINQLDRPYTVKPSWHVYMIDESHEHGVNMDLLLTYLRYKIHYNNALTLVVTSATIDADEARLRSFYRGINDNRKYPIAIDVETYQLDRYVIDRRCHISLPESKTNFEIVENWVPKGNAIKLAKEIAVRHGNNNGPGDILIFEPGKREIDEVVKKLNTELPPKWIALPFYSGLTEGVKDLIRNIDSNIARVKISREKISELDSDFPVTTLLSGGYTYKHVVIVATNLAEASLTLRSLKYIIDTGRQKRMIFDYDTRISKIVNTSISQTSHVQRKGRVGRVATGEVYYLYRRSDLTKLSMVPITIEDITMKLYSKLARYSDAYNWFDPDKYESFIDFILDMHRLRQTYDADRTRGSNTQFTSFADCLRANIKNKGWFADAMAARKYINSFVIWITNPNDALADGKWNYTVPELPDDLQPRLLQQYLREDGTYCYRGNPTIFPYDPNPDHRFLQFEYNSGFKSEVLTDFDFEFYFISPIENELIRNLSGDVVAYHGAKHNEVYMANDPDTTKLIPMMQALFRKLQLLFRNLNFSMFAAPNCIYSPGVTGLSVFSLGATNLGKDVLGPLIKNAESIPPEHVKAVLYGGCMGIEHEMLKLCSFYDAVNNNAISAFVMPKKQEQNSPTLQKLFDMAADSDSDVLLVVINQLERHLASHDFTFNYPATEIERITQLYADAEDTDAESIISSASSDNINDNQKNMNDAITDLMNNWYNGKFKQIEHLCANGSLVERWCHNHGLKLYVIQRYLLNRLKYIRLIAIKNNDVIDGNAEVYDQLKQALRNIRKDIIAHSRGDSKAGIVSKLITVVFLFAYPENVFVNISYEGDVNKALYIRLQRQGEEGQLPVYEFNLNPKKRSSSLIQKIKYDFLFSLSQSEFDNVNVLHSIHSITPRLISYCAIPYNEGYFNKLASSTIFNYNKQYQLGSEGSDYLRHVKTLQHYTADEKLENLCSIEPSFVHFFISVVNDEGFEKCSEKPASRGFLELEDDDEHDERKIDAGVTRDVDVDADRHGSRGDGDRHRDRGDVDERRGRVDANADEHDEAEAKSDGTVTNMIQNSSSDDSDSSSDIVIDILDSSDYSSD